MKTFLSALTLLLVGCGGRIESNTPSGIATTSTTTSTSTSNAPFQHIGTVSGIEVIDWTTPPTYPPDDALNILFEQNAEAFYAHLKQALAIEEPVTSTQLSLKLHEADYLLQLCRFELVRLAGTKTFDALKQRTQGKTFLTAFLSNQEWLNDFLAARPLKADEVPNQLMSLCTIFRYDKECTLPIYRKLATVYALQQTKPWDNGATMHDMLDVFQTQKRNHQNGRMHAGFDKMETWEMQYVTAHYNQALSQKYLINHVHYPRNRYWNAAWHVNYQGENAFGDTIQGPLYYIPWSNDYPIAERRHKAGGVCGTLSHYGSALARAHGVPAFPVGQPGHCAYMLRNTDTNWGTAYNVTGNTKAASIFGHGDESIVRLMQAACNNTQREQLLKATHHNLQANYFVTMELPPIQDIQLKLYHNIGGHALPNFDDHQPVETFKDKDNFSVTTHFGTRHNWVGAVLTARFELTRPTTVTCSLHNDDAGRVLIDSQVLINAPEIVSARTTTKTITLEPGPHTLRLEYCDINRSNINISVCDFSIAFGLSGTADILAHQASVQAQPLHLNHWQDYIQSLDQRTTTSTQREEVLQHFVTALASWHRPCLDFLDRHATGWLHKQSPNDQTRIITAWHEQLLAAKNTHTNGKAFEEKLTNQTRNIHQPDALTALFRRLLRLHEKGPYFSQVLSWGRQRLASNPATQHKFTHALASLDHKGEKVRDILAETIIQAAADNNTENFATISKLAMDMFADEFPSFLHMHDSSATPPKMPTFPGELLSRSALPTLSSSVDSRATLTWYAALQPNSFGAFVTQGEAHPWVTIRLPGPCRISGIAALAEWEEAQRKQRLLPLHISISSDGQNWQQIYTSQEARDIHATAVSANAPAQYVRFERAPDASKGHFGLRAIRIFGTPLY